MYRRLPAGKGRVDPKGVVEAQMPARRRRYDFFSRPVSPMKIRFRRSFLHLIYIFWAGLDRRKRIFIRYGEPQAHGNSVVNKVLEFSSSSAPRTRTYSFGAPFLASGGTGLGAPKRE